MTSAAEAPVEVLKEGTVWIATTTQLNVSGTLAHCGAVIKQWIIRARACYLVRFSSFSSGRWPGKVLWLLCAHVDLLQKSEETTAL